MRPSWGACCPKDIQRGSLNRFGSSVIQSSGRWAAGARRRRHQHPGVLRAEERVPLANRAEDAERAVAVCGRSSELFELPVRPVPQQHLPLELIPARRNHLLQPMPLAQCRQLGILERVELEPLGELALHVRQRVQPFEVRLPPLQLDGVTCLLRLRRWCRRQ